MVEELDVWAVVILEVPDGWIDLPSAEAVGVGLELVVEAVESVEVVAAVLGNADQDVFEVLVQ